MKKENRDLIEKRFFDKVSIFLKKNPEIKNIIVGYSTGPDSTFLIYLLKKYENIYKNIKIIGAHIFHDWGSLENSIKESQIERKNFSINFCEKLKIPIEVFIGNSKDFEKNGNGSLEAAGRAMRIFYFDHLLEKYKDSIISLGHTEDEQIETFFIKLFRGSSLNGLTCMDEFNNKIFRPLLNFKKSEILNYLKENKIKYCIDETNFDESFLRVNIRKNLIPILDKIDSRSKNNILKTINNLKETEIFSENEIKKILENKEILEKNIIKNIKNFKDFSIFIKKKIILKILFYLKYDENKISNSLINEIIKFIEINNKSKNHKINNLLISKNKDIIFSKI